MLEQLLHSSAARALFSETQRLQSMLDFEAALALVEAKLKVIPQDAAEAIGQCCAAERFDREALARHAAESGNVAIPMVAQLTALVRKLSPGAAAYVHWGATSQDAIDTGLMLQLRAELSLLDAELATVCDTLAILAQTHRSTLMAGRTWLQQAVPITFGFKAAGWLDALLRCRERIAEIKPRVLSLQFGGAAGTLAALGPRGMEVAAALADELGLTLPALPWHANRDRIGEVACLHGMLAGTLGKIARDVSLLMQTEVGEAAEPASAGRGGSSTMPQKRNPVAAAAVLAASIRVPGLVSTVLSAMVQEHERGLGGWHAEWETLPEICTLTLGALEKLSAALENLYVSPAQMRANLESSHGLIFAEAVSMRLAHAVGKEHAHKLVAAASERALSGGTTLREAVEADSESMQHLSSSELDGLFDPQNYTGGIDEMIDRVLRIYEAHKNRAVEEP